MFKPHAHNLNTLLSSSSRYFRGNALIIFFFPIKCMGIHYTNVWFHVNCIDVFGISAYLHKYSMLNRQRETKRNRFAQICGWAVNGNTCLVQGHCWHRFHYFLLYLLLLLLLYFLYLSFWFCYANCLQFHSALSICGVHLSVFSFIPKYCLFNHNLDPQKKCYTKFFFH